MIGPTNFIFMLTRNDKTVPNAIKYAREAILAGVTHIGFKDIGISFQQMKELVMVLRAANITTYLEVVSLDAESEMQSAEMAIQLKVDYLLGGTRPELLAPLMQSHSIKYFPFVGAIHGHPSELRGTITEISRHAKQVSSMDGVDGLDLLAYRFKGDVPELIRQVKHTSFKPLIVAGSINTHERIKMVKKADVQGFTIGTAVFENRFLSQQKGLSAQLTAVLQRRDH